MSVRIEKRRVQRFEIAVDTVVNNHAEGSEPFTFYCRTRDLSSGGAYIHTDHILGTGTTVSLLFEIPVGPGLGYDNLTTRLQTCGTVVRTSSNGMAVRFDKSCRIIPSVSLKKDN